MKNILLTILVITFVSCLDDNVDSNRFLPNVSVNVRIDLNLPQYVNNLNFPGGYAYAEGGIRGLIIYNTGTGYVAFDRACPHIELQSCSTMEVDDSGLFMVCPCDGERFQIINGAPENGNIPYSARAYTVTINGSILTIRS